MTDDIAVSQDSISSAEAGLWEDIKEQYSIASRRDVSDKIKTKLGAWSGQVSQKLAIENPFLDHDEKLVEAESSLQEKIFDLGSIKNDIDSFSAFKQSIDQPMDDFWQIKWDELFSISPDEAKSYGEQKKSKSNNAMGASKRIPTQLGGGKRGDKSPSSQSAEDTRTKPISKAGYELELVGLRGALQKKWREELDLAHSQWELEQINEYRRKVFEELKSWLELLQKLYDLLSDLSLEPGLLFDLSEGSLTEADIDDLKKWAAYISNDEGTKALCDMMGRLRRAERSKREEVIKYTTKIDIEVPDINSREEITGIKLGREIENAIPQELALLADDDTSLLFDLKYIESRLLCFENQGTEQRQEDEEREKKVEVSEEEAMGPVIVCVDTSGSMQGTPEAIAKAMTLYMATRAASQDRNCYLINFSTSIETLDLSGGVGLEKVIGFLRMSFHGGTDVGPALEHAIKTIREEGYQQSDVLVISDFVMGGLPEDLRSDITEAKGNKNRFYSLCIGEQNLDGSLEDIFDKQWVYDPRTAGIRELHSIVDSLPLKEEN